jgi:undecaprenol kinase/diacylglycerol kinase (ATP)
MKKNQTSIKKALRSFVFAFNGLKILIREEQNARIHAIGALGAIVLGFVLKISMHEWVAIILAIGFVITIETINSAIENLADYVSPDKHDLIKKVKDLSAGGVLLSAITALIIGLFIFLPKIIAHV